MSVPHRDLSPLLQWFRNFLLGRKYKNSLRFQDVVSTRSPPPPNLPDGPSHQLSNNYYFTRDGRHLVRPPIVLIEESKKKAITAGVKENAGATSVAVKKLGHILPGISYEWKETPKEMSK